MANRKMSPVAGGPGKGALSAASKANKKRKGGWKNGKSPSGWEAAAYTYSGNPPSNIGSSDIYRD